MSDDDRHDVWTAGQSYDEYMGRWSRAVADRFLEWLDLPGDLDWLDVGCGTGALTSAILERCEPRSVVAIDPSDGFVEQARSAVDDPRATFEVGTADRLVLDADSIDVVASALAYNFVPDRPAALAEFLRVARPDGVISLYVWDYPGSGVEFIDVFWKAAAILDPSVVELDQARRFPFCTADGLSAEFAAAGARDVDVVSIEVPTRFPDFDAFWHPFTLGAGLAPGYLAKLGDGAQRSVRDHLHEQLGSGPIELTARAWAARARL